MERVSYEPRTQRALGEQRRRNRLPYARWRGELNQGREVVRHVARVANAALGARPMYETPDNLSADG